MGACWREAWSSFRAIEPRRTFGSMSDGALNGEHLSAYSNG